MVQQLNKLLSSHCAHALALLALYLLLLAEYYRFVYRHFFYLMGFDFRLHPVSFLVGLLLLGVVFGSLFAVPQRRQGLYLLSLLVAALFCIPQIILFQVGKATPFGSLYSVLFLMLLSTPLLQLPPCSVPQLPGRLRLWAAPLLVLLASVPFVLTYGFHFDLSLFALSSHTYDVRSQALSQGNIFTAYLLGPLTKVLLPLLLVMGLTQWCRRWWLAVLAVGLMLYLFLITPQKSILFSIVLVMACCLGRNCYVKSGLVLYGLLALVLVSVGLNISTGHILAESIIVRRLFFIPALVADNYYVFFQDHPVLLSHSFLGSFFHYPYPLDPSHLIGQVMYNRTITSCNTGIMADGFMNFGHLGAILFVVLGALVLRFIDSLHCSSRYIGLVVVLLFSFLNGAFFTAMLTHGGLLLVLVMALLVPRAPVATIPQTGTCQ
ncbi:MAG: hypothetical protein MJZ67_07455 [Bacteroidales bacterium]|nr:hypothetical protein [Bacteroidales bacterium]